METLIDYITYLFLGLVQGITEPLPISSSGHLFLVRTLLNVGIEDLYFEVLMHFASIFAVIYLFKDKILSLIKGNIAFIFKKDKKFQKDFNYVLYIIVASIPVGILGLLLRNTLEDVMNNYGLLVISVSLLITGLFLWFLKPILDDSNKREITLKDALFMGVFQAFAITPGISRSGATFFGGALRKLHVKDIIEFSFMIYIPVTLAAGLLEILSLETASINLGPLALAFIVSMIMTYFALIWFRNLALKGALKGFSIYCFIVSTISLVFFIV